MKRMNRVVVVVLLACLGAGAAPGDTLTREEDGLLLEVAKRVLQDGAEYKFVCYDRDEYHGEPVSRALLNSLRRYRPNLRNCDEYVSPGPPLLLGPIYWRQLHQDAVVHYSVQMIYGWPGFQAHRGFLGRWHLTGLLLE